MTVTLTESPSRAMAAEIRAEAARQGISQRELARRMGRDNVWLSRRIGTSAKVDLTLEEILEMTNALGVSAQGVLSNLLPRLDSNQQPSGYPLTLVSGITRTDVELVA